ncbi:MAG: TRAP transporter small permease subunit [Pseudomonadota bacterium]
MPFITLLRRAVHTWALFGGVLLLGIVIVTAVNAAGFAANMIARAFGGHVSGVPGYEDAVTMLVGVAALSMFPYCQWRGGHAAVDVVMQLAPGWANRAVCTLTSILMVVVAVVMAVMLTQGAIEMRQDSVETPVLGWPVWVFVPTAVISCTLWAFVAAVQVFVGPETGDGP